MKIIAEIGKNFVITEEPEELEVLIERAKALILEAKRAGCDVAKFQVHCVDDEIHPDAKIISPHFDHDRYEWVKRNTYPVAFWMQIADYCREANIEFLATPMSRGAAILLDVIGVDSWKVGSGDILDFVMLDYIRDTGKPVILSSGMSTLEELKTAYEYLKEKTNDVSILHCVSKYPCPLASLNLGTIPFLQKNFPDAVIGFSDHSIGIEGSLMAVALGAKIIEKHFSFDREAWGPDHKVSLHPDEMKLLVESTKHRISQVPSKEAYGTETKFLQEGEEKFRKAFRKGLYASQDIKQGDIMEPDMVYAMRPNDGALPSEHYPTLMRMRAIKDYKQYEKIS